MNKQSPHVPPPRSGDHAPETEQQATDESASAAFHDAAKRIAEVREYVRYYIAVQMDAAKLVLRNTIFYAVVGIVGLVAAASAVVVAVVFVLSGIANGIGVAMGGRFWLGDLIVGIFILGAIALGAKVASSMLLGSSRRKTVKKYESLQRQQRDRFGHDVGQHAE